MAEVVFGDSKKVSLWMIKTRRQFDGQSTAAIAQTEAGARMLEDVLVQIDFGITA